jgi:hypothetical protein
MFLKHKVSGHLLEVLDLDGLFNLFEDEVAGRYHYGEEVQDPENFRKSELAFLSGEALPRCWTDPHYRDEDFQR